MRQDKKRGSVCVYPDKRRGTWRIQVTRADRSRASYTAYSKEQAEEIAAAARGQLRTQVQTVGEAIDMYLAELDARETTESHRVAVKARLKLMFPNADDMVLKGIHPVTAQGLYDRARKGKSVDYHRNALLTTRSMFNWLIKRGELDKNPFAEVQGVGKRKRGKKQLTIDESRKFVATCLEEDSTYATAALCCLLLAMRAGEIVGLEPRALDDGGRILRVERDTTKTDSGERLIEIPDVLRSRMPELAAADMTRHRINHHVRRLCKLAGVTIVGPHALRGTHASLATRAGATSQLVASTLGHARTAVTEAHYTERGATEAQAGATALRVLVGGLS